MRLPLEGPSQALASGNPRGLRFAADPDYIEIKESISQRVLAGLFAHTRRLQEAKGFETYTEPPPWQDVNPLNPDRNSNYQPPKCVSFGAPLSFDVGLKASTVKQSVGSLRADPSHRGHVGQRLDVVSSRMPGYGKVILYRTGKTVNEGQDPQFSWTHTQTDTKSFDDFMRFASNVPNLGDENRALVVSLLKRAQRDLPGSSEPHYVMRCVGTNSTQDHTEKSAIFLRLPYYSTQKMDAAQSFRKSDFSTRSLLQYFYNLESTRNRDLQQVIRKSGVFPKGHIIHVSELWAVIVNFQFIITSAPIPLMDGASPSLEIISPPAAQSSSPTNICVINPDQRVFFFPVEHCKTFFAMRDKISRYCLPQIEGHNYESNRYEDRRYEGHGYEGRGYEPRGYEGRSYEARGYGSRAYEPRGYEGRSYEARGYGSRAYEPRGYEGRSYEARGYGSREYEPRGYEGRSYEPRGYGSRAYGPRAYEGRSYEPRGYGAQRHGNNDFKMFTQDKVLIRAEDWIKLTASCASTLLRIHIETFIQESSEERRDKEKRGKSWRKPAFSDESSKTEEDKKNPSETVSHDHSEKSQVPPEADERVQPETDEDERGPHETEEPAEESQADWDYQSGKLDEVRYTGARHRSRARPWLRYFSYSPGVVINQRLPGDDEIPSPSNIYFEPTKPILSWDTEAAEQDIISNTADAEEQTDHGRRSMTSDSAGNSSASQASPPPHRSTINLEFPPVFTWQTRKRPSRENNAISKSNIPLDNTSPDHLKSNVQYLNERPEPLSVDEETIKHVSAHINNELLEPTDGDGWEVYRKATTKSYFDVDRAITQIYAVSLPTLIAEHAEIAPESLSSEAVALKDVIIRLCRLFSFFAPLSYPCAVSGKFWGAVHDLLTTIPQYWDKSHIQEPANRTRQKRMPETFFIANIGSTNYADIQEDEGLDELTFSVGDCSKCSASRQYSTRSDAIDHLFTHVSVAFPEQRSVNDWQSRWVMEFGEYMTYICRKDDRIIIGELQDFLTSLETMAAQIQHGVSAKGEFDRDTYRIPSNLVDAFQDILMMVVTSAHLVNNSHKKREIYTGPDPVSTFLISSEVDGVTDAGTEAEMSMESAMRDIVLMTYTDEISDVVTYEAVGPGLVLALIMGDVRCRDSQSNPVNLLEIYREYVRTLQFKASQNPHRRVLQEIYLVREELEIIQKASERQRLVLSNYLSVINPHSFRITTESRLSAFELEKARLNKLISQLNAELGAISLLNIKLDSLANQTRSGVDVRQEDQGKAILVFTIVTVVFMPLSFVTSYLGMNTNDIRNMTSSQTLFWAISAPLTVGIITIVLVVAFQVDRIREAFDAFWTYDSALGAKSGSAVLRGKGTGDHIGKLSGMSTPKNWATSRWPAGRKTEQEDSMGV
ncbi:hypothetical protein N7517_007427 [Penicillium concentricum]|uniref:Mg2+ transporter protein, CorA-like/Zinc transport protein ZntB n=1 Tax=Penicillium concentricum TaxID=293559 RepID=A0A9W9SB71_9EURO|nr:uncharacterized protein N7517_007427 [Penicillium concentricum]KAJ5375421.1 hypothetical protein N7517_007427 [Penicillium concentricum]